MRQWDKHKNNQQNVIGYLIYWIIRIIIQSHGDCQCVYYVCEWTYRGEGNKQQSVSHWNVLQSKIIRLVCGVWSQSIVKLSVFKSGYVTMTTYAGLITWSGEGYVQGFGLKELQFINSFPVSIPCGILSNILHIENNSELYIKVGLLLPTW